MDQVHGFGSWVHGIVDQSRPLILIWAARILLKWKGIDDLIPTLDHDPPDGGGAQARCGSTIGGSPKLCPWALRGTVTRGVWGKMTRGSTGFLPGPKRGREWLQDGSRRRLPSSEHRQWWTAGLALFRLQEVAQRLPRGLLLLLGRFNGSNRWRLAQIWWRLGFGGFQALRSKIRAMGWAIYRGF
jgi:hypothetical protein